MRRGPLIMIVLIGLVFSRSSDACMASGRTNVNAPVTHSGENAIIFWDENTKTEHLLRRVVFENAPQDFAWIIPTPSKPELGEFSEKILEKFWNLFRGLDGYGGGGNRGGSEIGASGGSVQVMARAEVANMDAVTLQSDDAQALQKWLRDNNYSIKGVEAWAKTYIEKKWVFTVFKLSKKSAGKEKVKKDSTDKIENPLVRISFKTDRPFYPYREVENTNADLSRELRLYVLAKDPVEAQVGNQKWDVVRTTIELDNAYKGFLEDTENPKREIPNTQNIKKFSVTYFTETNRKFSSTEDLFFNLKPAGGNPTKAKKTL